MGESRRDDAGVLKREKWRLTAQIRNPSAVVTVDVDTFVTAMLWATDMYELGWRFRNADTLGDSLAGITIVKVSE